MKHLENGLEHKKKWYSYILIFVFGSIFGSLIGMIPKGVWSVILRNNIIRKIDVEIIKNVDLVVLLIPFLSCLMLLLYLIKRVNNQSYKEIINGTNKIRWSRYIFAFFVWFSMGLMALFVDIVVFKESYTFSFHLSSFIPLLLIALIFIPIQTAFEELVFRGYFAQGIGALTRNRWLVWLIPSVIFALMHCANPEVKEYGFFISMANYLLMGLLLGLVSILDDGIELAMGVHCANNIFCSTIVTFKESVLNTGAIFTANKMNLQDGIYGYIFTLALAFFIFKLRYKLNFRILSTKI